MDNQKCISGIIIITLLVFINGCTPTMFEFKTQKKPSIGVAAINANLGLEPDEYEDTIRNYSDILLPIEQYVARDIVLAIQNQLEISTVKPLSYNINWGLDDYMLVAKQENLDVLFIYSINISPKYFHTIAKTAGNKTVALRKSLSERDERIQEWLDVHLFLKKNLNKGSKWLGLKHEFRETYYGGLSFKGSLVTVSDYGRFAIKKKSAASIINLFNKLRPEFNTHSQVTYKIKSDPDKQEVTIDDRFKGITPYYSTVTLTKGLVTSIEVHFRAFNTCRSRLITIKQDPQEIDITFRLEDKETPRCN